MSDSSAVTIAGGGLSGLAAALAVARRGGVAHVFERRRDVGARFHGDFQGLENWSTDGDVLEELESMGIAPTFSHAPFRECVFFGPDGRDHVCRSSKPLWYLVRRGTDPGTLDQALKTQALAAGVELRCGESVEHLPDGGIVAHGPRRVDAIAVGYVFATDRSDAAFGAVSDDLAPGGYAYLLICRGRATLATCMFDDFHNDKQYLARTVDFFERTVGVTPRDARAFGGFGNMSAEPTLRRGNMLVAGEAAGLQDALFGFGMRYALVSGHLAGDAFADNDLARYERDYRRRFAGAIRASAVNRYLYRRAGRRGYQSLVDRVSGASNPRAWLKGYYNGRWWLPLVFPFARAEAERRQASPAHECREGCDCTYCRCLREAAGQIPVDDATAAVDRNVSEPVPVNAAHRKAC
jgi:flavin-dependent dehydrogenase